MSRDIVTPTPYVTWPRGMPRDIVTPITGRCAARAERRATADRREAAEAGGALRKLQEQVQQMEARMEEMELRL